MCSASSCGAWPWLAQPPRGFRAASAFLLEKNPELASCWARVHATKATARPLRVPAPLSSWRRALVHPPRPEPAPATSHCGGMLGGLPNGQGPPAGPLGRSPRPACRSLAPLSGARRGMARRSCGRLGGPCGRSVSPAPPLHRVWAGAASARLPRAFRAPCAEEPSPKLVPGRVAAHLCRPQRRERFGRPVSGRAARSARCGFLGTGPRRCGPPRGRRGLLRLRTYHRWVRPS